MPEPQWEDIRPFVPHALDDLIRSKVTLPGSLTPERYARAVKEYGQIEDCRVMRITYRSGGFRVTGMLAAPLKTEPGKHPLILFNRGGNREFGKLTVFTALRYLAPLCRQNNAIVYASNYRGVDGGEGADEFGGTEVEDVLTLLVIARAQPEWDKVHSLMFGHSRGGMMTALALRQGAEVSAAVLSAAATDIRASGMERADLLAVYAQTMPGFQTQPEECYRERSAICWPGALRVPLLLLHGDADDRVNVMQSIRLAQALENIRHPHELVVYPGDDHFFVRNQKDMLRRAGDWMRKYRAQ